jgi:predicted DNA-binding ribbon-helix-helix protein
LKAIAAYQKKPLARLVFDIKRNSGGNLSSTARVYVLNFVKQEIEYGKVLGL